MNEAWNDYKSVNALLTSLMAALNPKYFVIKGFLYKLLPRSQISFSEWCDDLQERSKVQGEMGAYVCNDDDDKQIL